MIDWPKWVTDVDWRLWLALWVSLVVLIAVRA